MNKNINFVDEHIGLVHSCAKKFKGKGIEYDDLFQAGCMGLVKAADNFDSKRGFKFSTYAVPVILGEIKGLFRKNSSVKISRSIKDLSLKVNRVCDELRKSTEQEPTVSEIAKKLNVDTESVAQAMNASMLPMSINELTEESGDHVGISVGSEEEKIVELISLRKLISELSQPDKMLILLRFFRDYTQTETAKVLNMSQVQVSRREKTILKHLRNNL